MRKTEMVKSTAEYEKTTLRKFVILRKKDCYQCQIN